MLFTPALSPEPTILDHTDGNQLLALEYAIEKIGVVRTPPPLTTEVLIGCLTISPVLKLLPETL